MFPHLRSVVPRDPSRDLRLQGGLCLELCSQTCPRETKPFTKVCESLVPRPSHSVLLCPTNQDVPTPEFVR